MVRTSHIWTSHICMSDLIELDLALLFMKAVEAPGDARAEWEFLHDLVHNVTGQNGFVTIEGLFNEMAKDVAAFNGLAWANLGDTGVTVQI